MSFLSSVSHHVLLVTRVFMVGKGGTYVPLFFLYVDNFVDNLIDFDLVVQ